MEKVRKYWPIIIIFLLVLVGLVIRLWGIKDNHSFWSDEAYVSYIAREIGNGQIGFLEGLLITRYQPMQTALMSVAFVFLGPSEFAARIPVVIIASIGIVFAFLLAKKFSNIWGGLLAAFLYTFSQLNLANATQSKPYAIIQTITLISLYLVTLLNEKSKKHLWIHIGIISLNIFSTLLNFIGALIWIPYFTYLLLEHGKNLKKIIQKPHPIILVTSVILIFLIFVQGFQMLNSFIHAGKGNILFTFNHTTYLRELLWKNYGFVTLPALFGVFLALKSKYRNLQIGIMLFLAITLYLWSFKHYTHNVRYLVPFFGLLFVYFGVFWGVIAEKLFAKKEAFVIIGLILLLFIGGNKIVRKPATYYNPNADLISDVQNADYANAFAQLKKMLGKNDYVIYNDSFDTQAWYLDGRLPDGLFMRHEELGIEYGGETKNITTGIPVYTSVAQLEKLMQKNKKGYLVVEDWHSFLPEEVKEYAKKNLKRVIRVEGLPQAQGDNWPLEVYSWGGEK